MGGSVRIWLQIRLQFLQTAEMLKPSTPSPSHESSGGPGSDEGSEYYPNIVFLQNKARREDFCPRNLKKMHMVIDKLMLHSHLKYKGTLSMLDCNIFPGLSNEFLEAEVNLFLLPVMESEVEENLVRAGSIMPLESGMESRSPQHSLNTVACCLNPPSCAEAAAHMFTDLRGRTGRDGDELSPDPPPHSSIGDPSRNPSIICKALAWCQPPNWCHSWNLCARQSPFLSVCEVFSRKIIVQLTLTG
ncbi:hypothetical protein scyTo_0021173 [Scyliorhinus torazame]|uniref:Uncharacterized protein n=1 Tax=Scyliorhinus torazame TaxID=75743 RepID=A0A401PYH5_SCYTO|nr:hypothetical protein [Scyliorhinus torazame]